MIEIKSPNIRKQTYPNVKKGMKGIPFFILKLGFFIKSCLYKQFIKSISYFVMPIRFKEEK